MATSVKPVLAGLLAERAAEEPESPALTVEGATSVTYGEWHRRSDAGAWGLSRRQVGPGHRVALLFDRAAWVDFAVSYAGVQKAGAAAVPVDAGVGPLELARVLDDCRASGLVTRDPSTWTRGGRPWVAAPAELEAGHDGEPFPVPSRPTDTVDISYLSGSLRRPVGVGRGEDEIVSDVDGQHRPR
ncbi:MAG: AMP-binding protein, partial [Actinomycetota bacterium]|nr:AMP-binding protein [Actinomycetota bacterium]